MLALSRIGRMVLIGLVGYFGVSNVSLRAQNRLSDRDVEGMMRNLKDDAKGFRPTFTNAIQKSAIHRTGREKEAKNLAQSFEKDTNALWEQFKATKKAGEALDVVMSSAHRIDGFVVELRLNPQTSATWDKMRIELTQLAGAFGLRDTFGGGAADLRTGTAGMSCTQTMGAERARKLSEDCMAVSPGSNPPCSAQNSCSMITDEIKRSCGLLGRTAPIFCADYVSQGRMSDGGMGQTVSCYSDDGNRRMCDADTSRGVELVRQRSNEGCQQGYSWGFDSRGIWVDHGCRADFRVR